MSFVDKIKGWGQRGSAEHDALEHDAAFADAYAQAGAGVAVLSPSDLPLADVEAAATFETPAPPAVESLAPTGSIISEAMPSEISGFTETRVQESDTGAAPLGAGLPLIGNQPVAQQQRILLGMLIVGLFLLVVVTFVAILSASRGSAQVAASGQALMQSQRLAKSVSQALVGSEPAFAEMKDSVDVLASNVRSLKTGGGAVPAAPSGVQDLLDNALPLVDRAEKNAGIVLAQQKVLTQVGQSLRAINRQSTELLEIAQTVASLKLQRDAS
ncbi:MAG: type IV pili methyl-accepting chemotaxis transducer N-terminal domain-containing protein, partial [Caldimonas sp.]